MANAQPSTKLQTTGNGQVVRDPSKPKTVKQLLVDMGPEIARALPKHVNPDRMSRIMMTALNSTPALAECTPVSFLGSVISAAQLGLEVNTPLGHAYLVPYKGQCTLIVGYKGMMDLARRSGQVESIYAHIVRPGDKFQVRLGLEQTIEHIPSEDPERETQPLTHVYAVAKLKGGDPVFVVLTKAQIEKFRGRSMSAKSSYSPWTSDYEAMALKTAIRRLFTWLPVSVEMARAATLDEAPEVGSPQAMSFEPSVLATLEAHGVATDEAPSHDDADPEPGSAG